MLVSLCLFCALAQIAVDKASIKSTVLKNFIPFFIELPEQMSNAGIASILYLGACVTLGAYGLYNYAITKVSILTAAVFTNLIPIFTLFLAAIILGETLTLMQWGAIVIVFAGVIVSQRHNKKHTAEETAQMDTVPVAETD